MIDPLFEVDERVAVPQRALKIVARDQRARTSKQRGEQLQRLRAERNRASISRKFERVVVELENAKAASWPDA